MGFRRTGLCVLTICQCLGIY